MSLLDRVRLHCPDDGGPLHEREGELRCPGSHVFPVHRGVPYLFPSGQTPPAPQYVDWIKDYERQPFSGRQRAKTARLLSEFLAYTRPDVPVLDVGCGRGDKASSFPLGNYVGIDPIDPIAHGMVSELTFPFVCGTGERLPFADEQFGSVILWGVLDHLRSNEAVYRESERVLRRGGKLCILNRAIARRRGSPRDLVSWGLRKIATLDVRGVVSIVRYSLLDSRSHRYSRFQTLDDLLEDLGTLFSSVEHRLADDGHVALISATK